MSIHLQTALMLPILPQSYLRLYLLDSFVQFTHLLTLNSLLLLVVAVALINIVHNFEAISI